MDTRISPAQSVRGAIRLPGDKSISHRYGILAGIAEGVTRIANFSTGADCHSTLACMEALGARVKKNGADIEVQGVGPDGLAAPSGDLDAGNSGTTMRLLSGVLAAQPFPSRMRGDESLSRRPMDRVIVPLTQMGAEIAARDGRFPPLEIRGRPLHPIDYTLPVASAQVKSCVLLAGLYADGVTSVTEPVCTRDHTEIALREFGAEVSRAGRRISVTGRPRLTGRELNVPGDLSSAAFFLAAATLVPDSRLLIENVGLNPTRAALLDVLLSMGAKIRVAGLERRAGEEVGALEVETAALRGGTIAGAATAAVIDEIPVLAVLGAVSEQGLDVRDAAELRVKETDRVATVASNLRQMGVDVEERPDGFRVPGAQRLRAAELDSHSDHRIAMAFAVAALAADGPCVIKNSAAASISFPEFFDTLHLIAG